MSKSRDKKAEHLIKWSDGVPSFRIRIEAPFAIFSNPCYTERVSYDVITPSAAEGLIRNIYNHPGLCIGIDKIHVLKPIKKESIKINGAHTKLSMSDVQKYCLGDALKRECDSTTDGRLQLTFLRLLDVEYVIEFHLGIDERYSNKGDTIQKFAYILADRLVRGACFEHPYLGIREYCCDVFPIDKEELIPVSSLKGERNLGIMFYGWNRDWQKKTMKPIMYNPIMVDGVIKVTDSRLYQQLD